MEWVVGIQKAIDYIEDHITEAPEISVIHWFRKPDNEKRYIELWLPVVKCNA